jgi:hypothetical protein
MKRKLDPHTIPVRTKMTATDACAGAPAMADAAVGEGVVDGVERVVEATRRL